MGEWFSAKIFTGTAKQLKLQLTLMPATTCLYNTSVAGMAVEKYFAVKLQLVVCKINIINTLHMLLTAYYITYISNRYLQLRAKFK